MTKAKARADLFDVVKARLNGIAHLLQEMDPVAAERLMQMLLKARRVFVTGKGRSGYVGQCFAMRLMQMGCDAHVPGEASCPPIRQGDVMVAVSCSGTTVSTVQFARLSHEYGAQVVAVTAVPGSPVTEHADHVILVPVTGKDVKKRYRYVLGPYNNTLFEQALLLYLDGLVYSMLERKGIPKRRLSERHANLE